MAVFDAVCNDSVKSVWVNTTDVDDEITDTPVPSLTLLVSADFSNIAQRHCDCFNSDFTPDTNYETHPVIYLM